jgi:hypothetical protein
MSDSFKDKINDYLEGKLNSTDLAAFEQEMYADDALVKAVEVSRLEKQSIELLIENDLRTKMKAWKGEKTAQKRQYTEGGVSVQKNNYNRRYLYLALLFTNLLIIGFYFFNKKEATINLPKTKEMPLDTLPKEIKLTPPTKPNRINNKPIAAENKKPKPNIEKEETAIEKEELYVVLANSVYDKPDFSNQTRRVDTTINNKNPLKPIMDAWKNKDFNEVIALAKIIDTNNGNYFRSQVILGHAYFNTHKFSEAETIFAYIAQSNTGKISEDAYWYQILCLVASGKTEVAKKLLNAILEDKKHTRNSDAQKLNGVLESPTKH